MDLSAVPLHPEEQLLSLYQGGCSLEDYVGDFIELYHQVHWNEVTLKMCFWSGLDDHTSCSNMHCGCPPVRITLQCRNK